MNHNSYCRYYYNSYFEDMSGKGRNKKGKKKKSNGSRRRDSTGNRGKRSDQEKTTASHSEFQQVDKDTPDEKLTHENINTEEVNELDSVEDKQTFDEKDDLSSLQTKCLDKVEGTEAELDCNNVGENNGSRIVDDFSEHKEESLNDDNNNCKLKECCLQATNDENEPDDEQLSQNSKENYDNLNESTESVEKCEGSDNTCVSPSTIEYIKHPLENKWTLWVFCPNGNVSWADCQKVVLDIDTIEDFWAIYHWTLKPSQLLNGYDYSLFKYGIKPMWEDNKNKDGGRWLIQYDRMMFRDDDWLELLMLMIGENFNEEENSQICGAVFNKRKISKIGVWLKDYMNEYANVNIASVIKRALGIKSQIGFSKHSNAKKSNYCYYA